jgi:hypothetical protein
VEPAITFHTSLYATHNSPKTLSGIRPSIYKSYSPIIRSRRQSWRDERLWYDDGFCTYFDKSRPDSLHTAATDMKHTVGNSVASSPLNGLYLALTHAISDKVAGVPSWSTMNLQGKAVAVISSNGGDGLPT